MSILVGTKIGPYEVTGVLGAGGMGEVYRARDTTLNRDVAIKVLPAGVAEDADRLARFTREAQTLAALNHPNIAHIYGFERAELALVMELVEGEDLSLVIARGALAPADSLPIARQIAEALEAAHEQGIIHRDLKPANVKVRADGTVKVLDFGLAKALTADSNSADANNSPTLTARATQLGVILGTAAYMAPEQAKGKVVDRRADIWAFGVVLYEMLTGRRAFDGEDVSTTLAAVLMKDPEWSALPEDTPPALRMLVRRCLERDPKLRLRDIGEARVLLAQPETMQRSAPATVAAISPLPGRSWTPALLAGAVILAVAAGAFGFYAGRSRPSTPADDLPVRFAINTSEVATVANLTVAVSPDGKTIAYAAPHPTSGVSVLWVRALNSLEARVVPGTENATGPFWSPESRRLGFAASAKLKVVDLSGGPPKTLCDLATVFLGGSWSANGLLISTGSSNSGVTIRRLTEEGTTVGEVLKPDASPKGGQYWPWFLPDGRHFLYLAWQTLPEKRGIYVASIDGGVPALVVPSSAQPVFAAPGTLMFLRDGVLMAQPFDADRLQTTGDPVRLATEVSYSPTNGRAALGASATGVLAFREGVAFDPIADLVWVDHSGRTKGTAGEAGAFNQLRLSPDEKQVALAVADRRIAGFNMWVLDLGNRIASQLTFEDSVNDPMWAPDSQSVMFESLGKGKRDFYRQVIGTRTVTAVHESDVDPKWLDDWSRDGQYVLFHTPPPGKLYALSSEAGAKPVLLAESTANFDCAHFSPDTKWVAYGQNESGQYEVWVAAFPAFDHRRRVSIQGGSQPLWRGDGRELFYLSLDGQLMSVAITPAAGGAIDFGAPKVVFQSPIAHPTPTIDQYAVTRDGQRFLFIQRKVSPQNAIAPITVVVNWKAGK